MRVEEIVAKALNVDLTVVDDETSRKTLEQWDSMGHLALVTSLEEEFNVSIALSDALEIGSVGDIKRVLRNYGVAV